MKRNILIALAILVTVAPYLYIIPAIAEMNMIAYHAFMGIGMLWGIVSCAMNGNAPWVNQVLTFVINMIAWPSCMAIMFYVKCIRKQNALFE